MNWYLAVLKNYGEISGRARRKEYWSFYLINFVFAFIAAFLDGILRTGFNGGRGTGIIYLLFTLVVFIPSLAVFIRRLHDVGKSGWWMFITLVPIIGPFWLLAILLTDSDPGENHYGSNPKENVNFHRFSQ
jgi:uncharacterized membrane protein YhaH (DUF805 family)